jgi:hypothetical protein
MSNDQKVISITTIPLTKLTVVINNFIANTITHLNKLSVKGDEKLSEFDNKLNDLDAMTTLLEAKLNSLPEKITSTYPPLEPVTLPDVNPSIVPNPVPSAQDNSNQSSSSNTTGIVVGTDPSVPPPPPPPPPPPFPCNGPPTKPEASPPKPVEHNGINQEQKDGEEPKENLSPAEELENFLKENEPLRTLHKMIKVGVPTMQVSMKAKMSGEFDMDLVEILFEKEKKVNPNLS